jgi:hypothetical protein
MATWISSPFVKQGLSDEGLSTWTRLAKTDIALLLLMMSMMEALMSSLKVSWGSVCSMTPLICVPTRLRAVWETYNLSWLRFFFVKRGGWVFHFTHGVRHGNVELSTDTVSNTSVLVVKVYSIFGVWNVAWVGDALDTAIEGLNAKISICLFCKSLEPI